MVYLTTRVAKGFPGRGRDLPGIGCYSEEAWYPLTSILQATPDRDNQQEWGRPTTPWPTHGSTGWIVKPTDITGLCTHLTYRPWWCASDVQVPPDGDDQQQWGRPTVSWPTYGSMWWTGKPTCITCPYMHSTSRYPLHTDSQSTNLQKDASHEWHLPLPPYLCLHNWQYHVSQV